MFTNNDNFKKTIKDVYLKKGNTYLCIKDYYPRADYLEFENGYVYVCESDGSMKGWILKNPEKYFIDLGTVFTTNETKFEPYKY